jgi:hypothetical protein
MRWALTLVVILDQSFNSKNRLEVFPSIMATTHSLHFTFTMCDVAQAAIERVFFGVFGNVSGCALYDITPTYFTSSSCTEGVTLSVRD